MLRVKKTFFKLLFKALGMAFMIGFTLPFFLFLLPFYRKKEK